MNIQEKINELVTQGILSVENTDVNQDMYYPLYSTSSDEFVMMYDGNHIDSVSQMAEDVYCGLTDDCDEYEIEDISLLVVYRKFS